MLENLKPDTLMDSNQTLKPLSSLASSALMSMQNNQTSETGPLPKGSVTVTGKPPSETTLNSLRAVAKSANRGKLLKDQELVTLLEQHFGPQRFSAKEKFKHSYGENGYDSTPDGWSVTIRDFAPSERALAEALEYLNRPAPEQFVAGKLAQLRTCMARARESENDIQIVITTYGEHLEKYPPDVVGQVIDKALVTGKWFPLLSELLAECNRLVALRRALLDAMSNKPTQLSITRQPAKLDNWEQPSDEQKKAVSDMVAEWCGKVA